MLLLASSLAGSKILKSGQDEASLKKRACRPKPKRSTYITVTTKDRRRLLYHCMWQLHSIWAVSARFPATPTPKYRFSTERRPEIATPIQQEAANGHNILFDISTRDSVSGRSNIPSQGMISIVQYEAYFCPKSRQILAYGIGTRWEH